MLDSLTFTSFYMLLSILSLIPRLVKAQSGDGGSASGVQPGEIGGDNNNNAGAAGSDTGAVHLSKGATIAIAVVVVIVVILVVTAAVLFYLTKKRQWKLGAAVRRTTRRMTTGLTRVMTPRTPHKMTFSPTFPTQRKQSPHSDRTGAKIDWEMATKSSYRPVQTSERDVEKNLPRPPTESRSHPESFPAWRDESHHNESKALPIISETNTDSSSNRQKAARAPPPPKISVPTARYNNTVPETPIWNKVFGR